MVSPISMYTWYAWFVVYIGFIVGIKDLEFHLDERVQLLEIVHHPVKPVNVFLGELYDSLAFWL